MKFNQCLVRTHNLYLVSRRISDCASIHSLFCYLLIRYKLTIHVACGLSHIKHFLVLARVNNKNLV